MTHNDEIDAREVFSKFKTLFNYLFERKIVIVLSAFLGASIGFYIAFITPSNYKIESSFMLESGRGTTNLSAYASLIGGLGLSGSSQVNISNDKLLEIIKSKRVIMNTLLKPYSSQEYKHTISFANYLINRIPNEELLSYIIPISPNESDYTELSPKELKSLDWVYDYVCEKTGIVFTKKSGIFKISFSDSNNLFAYSFTKEIINSIEEFLSFKTGEKQRQTFVILENKRDSITRLLLQKESELATLMDLSQYSVKSKAIIKNKQIQRDIDVLNTMYLEVVKNVEQSRMSMLENKSLLQVIDSPILPGEKVEKSKIKFSLLGGIISFLFATICLVFQLFRKRYLL